MSKAIEHAQWCQNHSNGLYGDQVAAMKDEFLRLAAVEQELADLKAAMGEPVAWMTRHDIPMLFPDLSEALTYCDEDEQPIPLYAKAKP